MASRIGLSQFVNADLLQQLSNGVAQSSSNKTSQSPSATQLSNSLRTGAQTYSTAVRSLNTTSTIVNLSEETLTKLDDLVTELIDLTKKATSPTMTQANREAINKQFGKLVEEYQDIVDNASDREIEFLTTGGLEAIFEAAGLDPESSGSIAALFKEFVTIPDDTQQLLASEKSIVKNTGFIPATTQTEDYSNKPLERVTSGPISNGFVTRQGNIFQAKDGYALQTPGYESLIMEDLSGNFKAFPGIQASGTFSNVSTILSPDGSETSAAIKGDFNQDGKTDYITGQQNGTVLVYSQDANGTFSSNVSYAAGTDIQTLVSNDFDNDGVLDFVSSNGDSTGSVYTGNGDGTFSIRSTFTLPNAATGLTDLKSSDLNGDGNADLISLDGINSIVDIFLGDGSGVFSTPNFSYDLSAFGNAYEIALGDVDGNRRTDLVIGTDTSTVRLFGNANGSFGAPTTSASIRASSVVLADFDLDGDLDQATINDLEVGSKTISIHTNDGSGNFSTAVTTFTGASNAVTGGRLSIGQFDQTRGLDIALALQDGGVGIFSGNGALGFTELDTIDTLGATLITGDFNSDGVDDLFTGGGSTTSHHIFSDTNVVAKSLGSNLTLLDVNKETGFSLVASTENFFGQNFVGTARLYLLDTSGQVIQQYTKNNNFEAIESASLSNKNQKVAYIANDGTSQFVAIDTLPGPGTYGYSIANVSVKSIESSPFGATTYSAIEISDDASNFAYFKETAGTSTISFRPTLGLSTEDAFLAAETDNKFFGFTGAQSLVIAQDTTADGIADSILQYSYGDAAYGNTLVDGVAITQFTALEDKTNSGQGYFAFVDSNTNSINVFREGTANALYTVQLGANDSVSSLSLTYDEANNVELGVFGRLPSQADTADEELYRVSVSETRTVTAQGSETFTSAATYSLNYNDALLVDLNGDNILDIVASEIAVGHTKSYLGNGTGTFTLTTHFATNSSNVTQGIDVGDINGDGELDLVSADLNTLNFQTGNGDGTFNAATSYGTTLTNVSEVKLADFDNDGNLDFAAITDNALYIARGRGDGTFLGPRSFATGSSDLRDLKVTDLNNDGAIDVFVKDTGTGNAFTYLGNGDGTVNLAASFFNADGARSVIADFNNDGIKDLVSLGSVAGDINVFEGVGDGAFNLVNTLNTGGTATSLAASDFNQDGSLDIAVGGSNGLTDEVFQYFGSGTFNFTSTSFTVDSIVNDILVGDTNQDGATDIVVQKAAGETFTQDTAGSTVQTRASVVNADNSPSRSRYSERNLVTTIFQSNRNLLSRSDAFAILKDLEKLQGQIKSNIEVLQEAKKIIQLNIDLSRAAGVGLLELSNEVNGSASAESLANALQEKIRKNAPAALSQAENLSPLAVAALLIS